MWISDDPGTPPADDTIQEDYAPIGPTAGNIADRMASFESFRKLYTGDTAQDQVLECGQEYEMLWKINKDTFERQRHTDQADFAMKLGDDCTVTLITAADADSDADKDAYEDDGVVKTFNVLAIIAAVIFLNA